MRLSVRLREKRISRRWSLVSERISNTNLKGAPAPVPELRLQSDLVVTVEGNLDDWADKVAKLKTNVTKEQIIAKLVPYIDGMALMGTYPVSAPREPGSDKRTFIYRIARTAENKDTWTSLLERPGSEGAHREISFTLGTEAGEILPSLFNQEAGGQRLQLMIVSSWWWLTAVLLFLFVIGIYLAAQIHRHHPRHGLPAKYWKTALQPGPLSDGGLAGPRRRRIFNDLDDHSRSWGHPRNRVGPYRY